MVKCIIRCLQPSHATNCLLMHSAPLPEPRLNGVGGCCMRQVAITSCDSYGLDEVAQHQPAGAVAAAAAAPAAPGAAVTNVAPTPAGQELLPRQTLAGASASTGSHSGNLAASKTGNGTLAGVQQQVMGSPRHQAAAAVLPPVFTAGTGVSSFAKHVMLDSQPRHTGCRLSPGAQSQLQPASPPAGRHEMAWGRQQQ
jgi:hypothetical protein